MTNDLNSFVELIRNQFSEKEQSAINRDSDIKQLSGWSSLQAMILVNEIDQEFGVILDVKDLRAANSVAQLYDIVLSKQN